MRLLHLCIYIALVIVTLTTVLFASKSIQAIHQNQIIETSLTADHGDETLLVQTLRQQLTEANEIIANLRNGVQANEIVASVSIPSTSSPTGSPTIAPTSKPTNEGHRYHDERLINDLTLPWNPHIYRPWLDSNLNTKDQQPPAMILLTTEGWNGPDKLTSLKFGRSRRETELYAAIVNHPWFHPRGWEEIQNGTMPVRSDIRYYVFADLFQCDEKNYPLYGSSTEKNMDTDYNRSVKPNAYVESCKDNNLFHRKLFSKKANATAKFVLFDCSGMALWSCKMSKNLPITVATISRRIDQIIEDRDQGLIPPAPNPVKLTASEEEDIRSCAAETNREFHAVYIGNFRTGINDEFHKVHGSARKVYKGFHDNNRTILSKVDDLKKTRVANYTYENILRNTEFGLAPRGDNKFSYRFTEVLSAGAIPVYHGDGYVFPFRPEIVDWNKCAVILPEKDAGKVTLDYISNLSLEERCRLRNYCYFGIYKKYVETPMGTINGLLEGLEALANGKRKPLAGVRCNSTSIENYDCNPIRR